MSCYFYTSYILRKFYNKFSRYNSLAKIRDVIGATRAIYIKDQVDRLKEVA